MCTSLLFEKWWKLVGPLLVWHGSARKALFCINLNGVDPARSVP